MTQGNTAIAVRNSVLGLLSLGCRLVGNMVIFIVIARLPGIDASEFGQLTYSVALGSLFVMISQFGLLPLLIRDIAADPAMLKSSVPSAFALRICFSLIGLTACFCYLVTLDMDGKAIIVGVVMVLALYIGSFSTDIQAVFQSQEKMHLELLGILTENAILLLLAAAAYFFHPSIIQVACIFLVSKATALAINYLGCGRTLIWIVPRIDLGEWKRLVREATPFALAGIVAAGIVQLDTVLMRELSPGDADRAIGMYQAAVRIFLIPMLLPEIVLKVFLPQLSRMHGRSGAALTKDLGRVNHVLLTLGLVIGMVTIFRGKDIIHFIYGEPYAEAGDLLQILGFAIALRFGAAYNLYFTIRNRIWFRVLSAVFALGVVIACDLILIPVYGPKGAAYAAIIANAIYWVPYLIAIFLAEKTFMLGWNFIRAGIAAAVIGLVLYVTAGIHVTIMLPVYFVLSLLAVFLTMAAGDRDRIAAQLRLKGA